MLELQSDKIRRILGENPDWEENRERLKIKKIKTEKESLMIDGPCQQNPVAYLLIPPELL